MTDTPLVVRDPAQEGEWETGCHYDESNDMALCVSSTETHYEAIGRLFTQWDIFMTEEHQRNKLDAGVFKRTSLAWILQHCGDLYDAVLAETRASAPEGDYGPNVARDWFCWLWREFRARKQEQSLQSSIPCP